MSTNQLTELLGKHAPKMPLHSFLSLIKEWEEMREELSKANYIIVTSLRLLGFNDNGYPTKQIEGLTDEDKQVISMMTRIQGLAACGIPGLEYNLEAWRKKFPIKKENVDNVDSSFSMIKNKF